MNDKEYKSKIENYTHNENEQLTQKSVSKYLICTGTVVGFAKLLLNHLPYWSLRNNKKKNSTTNYMVYFMIYLKNTTRKDHWYQ